MKDRFKFLRRSSSKDGSFEGPPSKRRKRADDHGHECVDTENLEEMISELKVECEKRKKVRCMATIQDLTSATFADRRKWINDVQPHVFDVLEMYPSLKIRKIVSITV